MPALLEAYDVSRFEHLVDVGGGEGALLRDILWRRRGFMVSYSICLRWWHVLPRF
jgi:hypothetical protein